MEESSSALGSSGKVIPMRITRTAQSVVNVKLQADRDKALGQDLNSLTNFFDYFKDETVCFKFLELLRWSNGPVCPFCGYTEKIYRTAKGDKCANKACGKKFTVLHDSVFEHSKLPLRYWFVALYLCVNDTYGINSSQLARYLNITQKSAWFMMHRIREALIENNAPLFGIVEADETYVGGRSKNKHAKKKKKNTQGRSLVDKVPVLGMVEREGRLVAVTVNNAQQETLKKSITRVVEQGAMLITDELKSYHFARENYYHVTMKHRKEQYVNDEFHTNTIEGFWGLLKRGLSGTFHQVSKHYLQRYLNEFVFRYNHRKKDATQRFLLALHYACFKRLSYLQLRLKGQHEASKLLAA